MGKGLVRGWLLGVCKLGGGKGLGPGCVCLGGEGDVVVAAAFRGGGRT